VATKPGIDNNAANSIIFLAAAKSPFHTKITLLLLLLLLTTTQCGSHIRLRVTQYAADSKQWQQCHLK
jgi:hypothetical protein